MLNPTRIDNISVNCYIKPEKILTRAPRRECLFIHFQIINVTCDTQDMSPKPNYHCPPTIPLSSQYSDTASKRFGSLLVFESKVTEEFIPA